LIIQLILYRRKYWEGRNPDKTNQWECGIVLELRIWWNQQYRKTFIVCIFYIFYYLGKSRDKKIEPPNHKTKYSDRIVVFRRQLSIWAHTNASVENSGNRGQLYVYRPCGKRNLTFLLFSRLGKTVESILCLRSATAFRPNETRRIIELI